MTAGEPCPFGDPLCPCQDGDICHYVDDPVTGTKAWPPPEVWPGPPLGRGPEWTPGERVRAVSSGDTGSIASVEVVWSAHGPVDAAILVLWDDGTRARYSGDLAAKSLTRLRKDPS